MEALIIVAHGSKMKSSNDEIVTIVEKIKETNENTNLHIFHAFLELSEPSLFITINNAINKNCKKIKIFPYFLAAGKHVLADIPNIIKEFKTNHKDIEFTVLPHFGQCNGVEDLILSNS